MPDKVFDRRLDSGLGLSRPFCSLLLLAVILGCVGQFVSFPSRATAATLAYEVMLEGELPSELQARLEEASQLFKLQEQPPLSRAGGTKG